MFIFGKNTVLEAIKSRQKVKSVTISTTTKQDEKHREILQLAKENSIPVFFKSIAEIKNLFGKKEEETINITAECEEYNYSSLESLIQQDKNKLIVILDHIQDARNFGSIVRTCAAADVSGIIIPNKRSCEVTSTVCTVSCGGIYKVKIVKVSNLVNTVKNLKNADYWVIASDHKSQKPYYTWDFSLPTALVIGNEDTGISRLLASECDELFKIPANENFPILNVSVSAGILIFESIRQTR